MPGSSIDNSKTPAPCARGSAVVPGSTAGCFALFYEVVALEYSDPAYGAVHLLTVDAHRCKWVVDNLLLMRDNLSGLHP